MITTKSVSSVSVIPEMVHVPRFVLNLLAASILSIIQSTFEIVRKRHREQQIYLVVWLAASRDEMSMVTAQQTHNRISTALFQLTQNPVIVLWLPFDALPPIVHLTWSKIPSISKRLKCCAQVPQYLHHQLSRGIYRQSTRRAQNWPSNISWYVPSSYSLIVILNLT